MEYVIIAITVLFGAGLTFFSGFGLGTLMLPVFSLFFDLPVAIGATAIVHFANNIFKFGMVYKHIHFPTLIRFGLPAMIAAIGGGLTLTYFDNIPAVSQYHIYEHSFTITPVKIAVGILMIFFAWFDLDPRFSELKVQKKHLVFGGLLSGYFGGFSGHQGAFRATFLTKAGLTKEQFIGTSNSVSLIVDATRMFTYAIGIKTIEGIKITEALGDEKMLLIVGVVFAFAGTFIGKRLISKTTITGIQKTVGILLFLMGALMISGII